MGPATGGPSIPGFRGLVPADIPAGIAATKITLTNGRVLIGDAGDVAQAVSVTGDITLSSGGVVAISTGVIVNADINASAAIDATKIANGSVSNTEFQFLDGVTSAIQTQLNTKLTIGGDTKGADIS